MTQMQRVIFILAAWARRVGPYLMLEILLPGGTLFALLLFLYQNRKASLGSVASRSPLAMTRAPIRNV